MLSRVLGKLSLPSGSIFIIRTTLDRFSFCISERQEVRGTPQLREKKSTVSRWSRVQFPPARSQLARWVWSEHNTRNEGSCHMKRKVGAFSIKETGSART